MLPATLYMLERAPVRAAEVPVPSPCVSICRLNSHTALCEGCFRTLDEIAAWSTMAEADKRRVWAALPQRAAQEQTP